MRQLIAGVLILLAGCGQAARDQATADQPLAPHHVTAGEITDPRAPTIGDLERRGLARVDDEATGWSCGPNCNVDGFTAIYMGREIADGSDRDQLRDIDRQFICPAASGDMQSWKCEAVEESRG